MRLDRFLWFARLAGSRKFAHALASAGRLRIDGRPTDRPAAPVRVGNVIAFATHGGRVRAVRIEALPQRRGPGPEAQGCYTELIAPKESALAEVKTPCIGAPSVDGGGDRA